MRASNLLCMTAALLMSATANADSDGYFCVGLDYVAVEFSLSKEPGNHRLYIVRVDDGERWRQPTIIELPPFQTHAMRCDARSVALDTGRFHEFRVTRVPAQPCSVRVTASVVQTAGGEDVASSELFDGTAPTECGE